MKGQAETYNFTWAIDPLFKNKYTNVPGIVIGRGINEYARNESLDSFKGKKIGCNEAYKVTDLDILLWLDSSFYGNHEKEILFYKESTLKKTILFAMNPLYYIHKDLSVYGLEARRPEKCSESFDSGFYPCELSGFLALNVALIMGINPIWLYGFTPDEKISERSFKFKYISDWCKQNNRQVFLYDENSLLSMFFNYKSFPLTLKKKKKKEI